MMVTTTKEPIVPKRSIKYIKLRQELKHSFNGSADIADRMYEQGKKDGLSNSTIREDIETTLYGVVKGRQLRNILPLELKYTKFANRPKPEAAMITASKKYDSAMVDDELDNKEISQQVRGTPHRSIDKEKQQEHYSFYINGLDFMAKAITAFTHQKIHRSNLEPVIIEQSKDYRLQQMKRMHESDLIRMSNYLRFLYPLLDDMLPVIEREIETKSDKDKMLTE
jgi:hypothetical protein